VTLLRVADPMQGDDPAQVIDPLLWQIEKREAEAYLMSVATRLNQADTTVNTVLLEGRTAERITEYSQDNDIDLMILSSHGRSGLSGWSISSIAQKILLSSPGSVMIVRAYQPTSDQIDGLRYRRLLVPLDGSLRAECVLPAVTTLAQHYQADVLLVHVVSKPEMARRMPPTEEDAALSARVAERNREEITGYFEQLPGRLAASVETRLIEADSVSAALHDLTESESVDLVILSAHGYSANTKWPYGSVVTNFIAYGTTPLMIIQDVEPAQTPSAQATNHASAPRPLTTAPEDTPGRISEN
jgi:nucleotide-binding universal stress UspA family protein